MAMAMASGGTKGQVPTTQLVQLAIMERTRQQVQQETDRADLAREVGNAGNQTQYTRHHSQVLRTEKAYVQALDAFVERIVQPLHSLKTTDISPKIGACTLTLLAEVAAISRLHRKLLEDLEERIGLW